MSDPQDAASGSIEETDSDRRRGILADGALSLDLVSALAGDRVLSPSEEKRLDALRSRRGPRFYSDLLYSVAHQYYAPEVAEDLWRAILRHKEELASSLKRNVGIAVAALDYLSNVTRHMYSATLVGEAHIEEIVALSLRDGLTGLFNHTYFYQQIDFELRRYARYGTLVSLVLIDIDDFKAVNDAHGHLTGSRMLVEVGRVLRSCVRDEDAVARYGGDEFVALLVGVDSGTGLKVAERIRRSVEDHRFLSREGTPLRITVSIGLSSFPEHGRTPAEVMELADRAMYRGKQTTRNVVYVASRDLPPAPAR